MICKKCGGNNPDDANFCLFCGTGLGEKHSSLQEDERNTLPPVPSEQYASNQVYRPETEGKPPKKRKGLVITGILVAVVLVAGAVIGVIFGWNAYQGNRFHEQLSLGEKYLNEMNYEEAVIALQAAVEIDPKNPEPYLLLADAYIAQEKYTEAQDILNQGYEATGGSSEIANKQEEVKELLEENTGKEEEPEEQPEEEATRQIFPEAFIENNGNVYYWQYTEDSFEQEGLMGNFTPVTETENSLVCMSPEGDTKILYTGRGNGGILLLSGRIYFTQPADASHSAKVCSVDLNGGDFQSMDGSLLAADVEQNLLIVSLNGEIQSVDPAGNRTSLTYGNFLSLSEGTLIYWVSENEGNAARLDAVELDGSGQRTLASFSIAQWSNMGGPAFTVQTVDDTVYFFFGIYGGTGMFLQEGRIYAANLDGSGFEEITEAASSLFYVYEENGIPMLLYNTDSSLSGANVYPGADTPTGATSSLCMNLETGDTETVDKPLGPAERAFSDEEGNYWVYQGLSGEPVQLIAAKEGYTQGSLGEASEGEQCSWIESMDLSKEYMYFTVITAERHLDLDMGWRPGFQRISTEVYRKNIASGEAELLYSY